MKENKIYIYGSKEVGEEELACLICQHISNGNQVVLKNIRGLHMDSVNKIRDYMMSILNGTDVSPWTLNQFFHKAVAELNIDTTVMFKIGVKPVKNDSVSRLSI